MFLHVARNLCKRLPKADIEGNVCVVVNLLDRAKDMINEDARVEVAKLFYWKVKRRWHLRHPTKSSSISNQG